MIRNENGLVNIKYLKEHPLNEKLYPANKHDHQIALLGEKMDEEYKQSGVPNHTPVDYCPETGTLNSGNFRYKSALLHGWEYLRAIPGRVFDSNYDEYDEMKFLEKFNKDGKRDEYEIDTLVHNYNQQNKAFEKKNGREFNSKERNQFAVESRIDKDKFRKIVTINDEHPSIYKRLIAGEITIGKAWRLAGKQKPDKEYNPDRHNFFTTLDSNPKIVEVALKKYLDMVKEFRSIGNGIIFDDDMGWENNQITGPLSNICMSAFVFGFNSLQNDELHCTTPRNKQGYADIHFENLTNKFDERFLSERIEVKMGSWNGNCSSTAIYGGMGSVKVTPHEYIIGLHNQQLQKHFIMITTLDKDDWKTDGKDSNATMTLSHWFNRYHKEKDKYRILLGDIYKGNKSIELEWA